MVQLATSSNAELATLVRRLLSTGPVQTHPAGRRIRIRLGGADIVDALDATFVWEHRGFPYVYVPFSHLADRATVSTVEEIKDDTGAVGARIVKIEAGAGGSTERAAHFLTGPLGGLVKVEPSGVDAMYEEDLPLPLHPRDPFKRIDCLPSSRVVRVALPATSARGAVTLVPGAGFSVHLLETLLPARYYLPFTAIQGAGFRLRKSEKRTVCPYKGEAEYYDVVVGEGAGEEVWEGLVWFYRYPRSEVKEVEGLACFYNEKLDIWLDGVKEERPVTHFA